jgi:hypothetical protein
MARLRRVVVWWRRIVSLADCNCELLAFAGDGKGVAGSAAASGSFLKKGTKKLSSAGACLSRQPTLNE